MGIEAIFSAFVLVSLAELGDKTQLVVVALSLHHKPLLVFLGAMLGILLVDGLTVLAGSALGRMLPQVVTNLMCAAIFLAFGVYTLFSKARMLEAKQEGNIFLTSFLLVSLMELGDKTQLSSLALSAEYGEVIMVGVALAYLLVLGAGVLLGRALGSRVRRLQLVTALLFFLFGTFFLVRALM